MVWGLERAAPTAIILPAFACVRPVPRMRRVHPRTAARLTKQGEFGPMSGGLAAAQHPGLPALEDGPYRPGGRRLHLAISLPGWPCRILGICLEDCPSRRVSPL